MREYAAPHHLSINVLVLKELNCKLIRIELLKQDIYMFTMKSIIRLTELGDQWLAKMTK